MNPKALLIRVVESLALTEAQIIEAFGQSDSSLTDAQIQAIIGTDNEMLCSDLQFIQFLDGLILVYRGPRGGSDTPPPPPILTNNVLLKKLRIALNLREPEMLSAFTTGGRPIAKRELTALFRKPGHKHYRSCDEATLDAFLTGIAVTHTVNS